MVSPDALPRSKREPWVYDSEKQETKYTGRTETFQNKQSKFDFSAKAASSESLLPGPFPNNNTNIGIALASPSMLANRARHPLAQYMETPPGAVQEQTKPADLQRKPSKWRKFGRLFRTKSERQLLSPHMRENEWTAGDLLMTTNARYSPEVDKWYPTDGRDNLSKDGKEKWPVLGAEQLGFSTGKSDPSSTDGAPFLRVEIPASEMERYSVMFGNLLAKHRQPPLLARRSKTLEDVSIIKEEPEEEAYKSSQLIRPALSSRRATSPSFSLFPVTPTTAQIIAGTQDAGHTPSSLKIIHYSPTVEPGRPGQNSSTSGEYPTPTVARLPTSHGPKSSESSSEHSSRTLDTEQNVKNVENVETQLWTKRQAQGRQKTPDNQRNRAGTPPQTAPAPDGATDNDKLPTSSFRQDRSDPTPLPIKHNAPLPGNIHQILSPLDATKDKVDRIMNAMAPSSKPTSSSPALPVDQQTQKLVAQIMGSASKSTSSTRSKTVSHGSRPPAFRSPASAAECGRDDARLLSLTRTGRAATVGSRLPQSTSMSTHAIAAARDHAVEFEVRAASPSSQSRPRSRASDDSDSVPSDADADEQQPALMQMQPVVSIARSVSVSKGEKKRMLVVGRSKTSAGGVTMRSDRVAKLGAESALTPDFRQALDGHRPGASQEVVIQSSWV